MKVYDATVQDMDRALWETNKKFDNNIIFNRCDITRNNDGKEKYITFTLKVKDSSKKGARRGVFNRQKIKSACWHAHGTFFDKLLEIVPDARIMSSTGGKEITTNGGNWVDYNIGSDNNPVYASEACECDT